MPTTNRRPPSALAPGDRLMVGYDSGRILGRRHVNWPDLREVVVEATSPGLVACRGADGAPFDIAYERRPYDSERFTDWRIGSQYRWSAPLPVGSPQAVKAYAEAMLVSDGKGLLVHLGGERGGLRDAVLVTNAAVVARREASEGMHPDDTPWTGEVVGHAAFWSGETLLVDAATLPGGAGEGDLVVAPSFRCDLEDGTLVTRLDGAASLGAFPDRAKVGAFLPSAGPDGPFGLDGSIHPEDDLAFLYGRMQAEARAEPDEALVLWHSGEGRPSCVVLATSGITFFHADCAQDYLEGEDLPTGLYLFENARWWSDTSYEGEHDAGIEGEWRAATLEDAVRHGFADHAALDAEIDGHWEWGGPGPDPAARLMEAAAAHMEAEAAAAPGP